MNASKPPEPPHRPGHLCQNAYYLGTICDFIITLYRIFANKELLVPFPWETIFRRKSFSIPPIFKLKTVFPRKWEFRGDREFQIKCGFCTTRAVIKEIAARREIRHLGLYQRISGLCARESLRIRRLLHCCGLLLAVAEDEANNEVEEVDILAEKPRLQPPGASQIQGFDGFYMRYLKGLGVKFLRNFCKH